MIELRDVCVRAGSFSLSNINLQVAQGEYCVLMGRTGLGKTTLLECIAGLRQLTAGRVLLHGKDVTSWSPADREIGYVPQDCVLFPTMTVREHLQFALKFRKTGVKEMTRRVDELTERLQIAHLLDRSPEGLSGGEAQRVALGRALSFQPSILLFDEPFSALDESTRSEMHDLLRSVSESANVTTLHVTHSSAEAHAIASRRLTLHNGHIIDETEAASESSATGG